LPKPWNNTTIRVTVYFAFEAIQLEEENRRLVKGLRRQLQFVRTLERDFPYLAALARQEETEPLLAQADRAGEERARRTAARSWASMTRITTGRCCAPCSAAGTGGWQRRTGLG